MVGDVVQRKSQTVGDETNDVSEDEHPPPIQDGVVLVARSVKRNEVQSDEKEEEEEEEKEETEEEKIFLVR